MNLLNYNTLILKQVSNVEEVWDMKYLSKTWNKWLVHWISQSIAHINLYGDFYNVQWAPLITIHQFLNIFPMWKESETWNTFKICQKRKIKWLVHWISQPIAHINLYGDFYNAQWTSWITIHQFWNRLPMWKESEAWAILEVKSLQFPQPISWAQMLTHLYNFNVYDGMSLYVCMGLIKRK
jgi:hypothetical protein